MQGTGSAQFQRTTAHFKSLCQHRTLKHNKPQVQQNMTPSKGFCLLPAGCDWLKENSAWLPDGDRNSSSKRQHRHD